ncbi:hypothetical protein QPR65_22360 (plasmid) [Enterobacter hormaechei]|uniref:hypothetical protein n=1 Tax=Enterobacter hormaechei TaxID=158836 RepID=UPI0027D1FE7F|nr:hypothetical protein [Enterobacter hormaechei]WLZ51985.1 hypothetical protein QPR65_22360 [Enterobacter hormaechei]
MTDIVHNVASYDPYHAAALLFANDIKLATLFTDVAKKAEAQGWLQGVIYTASTTFRSHGCSVSAKEVLETLGNELERACRISCEYDIAPLRLVIPDLPFGVDAEYQDLKVVCIDDNDIKCSPEDTYCYAVEGVGPEGSCIITRFETRQEAEKYIEDNI